MALLDGKQLRNSSLALAKLNNTGGQGTITFGSGTMLAVTDLPTTDSDIANKGYVDSISSGLDPKESVLVATTSGLGATYNGTAGIGGTGQFTGAPTSIDGQSLSAGDRVLVKDQTDAKQNGIYVVKSTTTIWDRSTDMDGSPTNEISTGNYTFVSSGINNVAKGYVLTNNQGQTGNLTLNTHNLIWVQFSASSQLSAGAGITTDGQKIAIELADNTLEFDTVGDAGQLRVNLATPGATEIGIDGSAGLVIKKSDVTGLIVASNGLTEATDGNGDKTVKLGGALTGVTSITGASAFDITTTGTQTYSTIDELYLNGDAGMFITGSAVTTTGSTQATLRAGSAGNYQTILIQQTGDMIVTDDKNFKGLIYAADYGTNFVDRSLVDKGYVDGLITAVSPEATSAGNGLTEIGNLIELGGTLTKNTNIDGDSGAYSYTITAMNAINLTTNNGLSLDLTGAGANFVDNSSSGITYNADYSANFVDRTLVDKGYVDGQISSVLQEATTASNGLTETGNDIQLGGALTQNTTIGGVSGAYNLTFNEINTLTLATSSGYSLILNGAATFTDTAGSKGLVYAADYSANFTENSLVTKAYVDANTAVGTVLDKNQTPNATSSDGDSTGVSIAATPVNDGYVEVLVNGQQQILGDGVKTTDCYFSVDGGTSGRAISAITAGDILYWNGSIAGFQLSATDEISFNYDV